MMSPGRAFSLNVMSLRQIGHSTMSLLRMGTVSVLSQCLANRIDLFDVEDQVVLLEEPGN